MNLTTTISFELFEYYINTIKKASENIHNISQYGLRYDDDHPIFSLVDEFIKLLDKSNNAEWISWWIYETNYGKKEMFIEDNGKKIYLKTVKDLWNYINEENNKKNI